MNFITNKYSKIYFSIIEKAKSRKLLEYKEKHHIVPKSLGGSDFKDNLVELTFREHFICHRLLVKMTDGLNKRKMIYGLWAMSMSNNNQKRYRINSRTFEKIKNDRIQSQIGIALSEERKKNIQKSLLGKVQSQETRNKRSKSRTGFRNTIETKIKMSESAKIRWANNIDDSERKQKIKEARSKQVIVTVQVTCPHCGKTGGNRIMPRYHFDNCKLLGFKTST
jgi:hypothetical protein